MRKTPYDTHEDYSNPGLSETTKSVESMTDREILLNIYASQRRTEEMVRTFLTEIPKNPMFKMMGNMFGRIG